MLRELGGDASLRGPHGPDGLPLRHAPHRFEFAAAEFAPWARRVAAAATAAAGDVDGYDVHVFGLGRARGDEGTKAAAAAAAAAAAGGGEEKGAADEEGVGAGGAAAELAARALAWGDAAADAAAPALPGIGHALHGALYVRRAEGGGGGGGGEAAGIPLGAAAPPALPQQQHTQTQQALLQAFWGPVTIVAETADQRAARDDGGAACAKPAEAAMEEV